MFSSTRDGRVTAPGGGEARPHRPAVSSRGSAGSREPGRTGLSATLPCGAPTGARQEGRRHPGGRTPPPRPVVQPPGAALTGDGLGVASASARAPSGDRQSPGGSQTRRPREPGGHLPLLGPGVGEPAALRPRPLADRKPRLASAHRGRKLVPETGASSRPQRRCRGEERRGRWGPGPQVLPQASAGPGVRPPGPAVTPAGERSSPCPVPGQWCGRGGPGHAASRGSRGPRGIVPGPAPARGAALHGASGALPGELGRPGPGPAGLASRGPRRPLPAGGAGSVSSQGSASDVHRSGTETVRAPGHWCAFQSLEKPTPGRGLTCQAAVRGVPAGPAVGSWAPGRAVTPSPCRREPRGLSAARGPRGSRRAPGAGLPPRPPLPAPPRVLRPPGARLPRRRERCPLPRASSQAAGRWGAAPQGAPAWCPHVCSEVTGTWTGLSKLKSCPDHRGHSDP